ncbi:DNA repair protein rad16 [Knufia obscura]|uniref:DNA repair protein rad16 n=1 Tax=Knufia obscura TaxID=1635080 RepID=A0ABR0RR60_9EURO|nr:DNA repair protein rad16 [Knufia obscura]
MEIPDSDEPEILTFERPGSTATFQGILIPTRSAVKKEGSSCNASMTRSKSTSITASADASDYDTPDTSAVTTPAEVKEEKRPARVSATARVQQLKKAKESKKRGRPSRASIADSEDVEDQDAKIAARLQAEEYAEQPPAKRQKYNMKSMLDSDDSSLSSEEDDYELDSRPKKPARKQKGRMTAMNLDTSDDELPLASRRPSKPAVRRAPPTRSAQPILDSEMSELSELGSQVEESEFDDNVTSTIADTDDASVDDGAALPTAPVINRGMTWHERRQATFEQKRLRRAKLERTKLETQHPEIKTMWKDLEAEPPIKPVAAQQPKHINRKLKPFQLEGLDWLQKQEKTHYRGGLLGDEMGMGKTIQACSLIMSDFPAKSPTLVVVPPVALMQWQSEITDYTSGALKVLVYHVSANPKCKDLSKKDLMKYNVIMISYSSLESIYRKENKGWTRGSGIVKEDSVIHAIKYHRVILDEAHSIKSRTTGVAKATFALNATYKWCLSGTPVQNRIGEFFSLLRFLDVRPFACYFCKACKCAELHWEQDSHKKCVKCDHSGFNHVSVFNQEILNPITNSGDDEVRKAGFAKLRLITDRIMLRRLKRDHTSSMELPPKEVIIHNEFFGEVERDFSQSIMSNGARKFDTYVSQGVMLNNYANIFGLIMQMRQVSDHPDLILRRHAEGGQNILVCCICDEPAEEAIRSKCKHEFCRQCAKNYIQSLEGTGGDADCPTCHIPLAIDWDQADIEQDEENVKKSSIINRIKMENWTSSTKIEMLVYDLYKLRSKKQTHKSIVFSQFTSMLQLVQWRLQKSGFTTVLLDGSMTPAQRQKSIEYFMENVEVEVFLVSLKAGGVALNLTEASRVFIIDPWWNPAAEWQSADRCHRIGQRRPCVITRLCIEDSVESRIILLQEKKANMINGTINNDQVAMEKLTPEDMQFLFRGS